MEILAQIPERPRALYVLAHGAGAGMRHRFLAAVARALTARGVATLRYEFPYMAEGRRAPVAPARCHATVREAVAEAARVVPGVPLLAGGKSFGGRMTSQAQAAAPLPGVRGLVFLGFPLHPPHRPGVERADHLAAVDVPMLFLQGTNDELARLDLLEGVLGRLPLASLHVVEGADHGFDVPRRRGRSPGEVLAELASAVAAFAGRVSASEG